jgi:hypothetical protein
VVLTPHKKKLAIIVIALSAAVVTTTLLLLALPIEQEQSGYTLIGLRLYSFEAEELFGASWSNFTYQGITFDFHLWCEITSGAGKICGNATNPNGHAYAFSFWDGPPTHGSSAWQTWVGPDAHEAVQYQQGGLVHLLAST